MPGESSLPALVGKPALWTLFTLAGLALVCASAILVYHWRTFDRTDRTVRWMMRLYLVGAALLLLAAAAVIGVIT